MPMFDDAKRKAEHELATVLGWLANLPEQDWPADIPESLARGARELRETLSGPDGLAGIPSTRVEDRDVVEDRDIQRGLDLGLQAIAEVQNVREREGEDAARQRSAEIGQLIAAGQYIPLAGLDVEALLERHRARVEQDRGG